MSRTGSKSRSWRARTRWRWSSSIALLSGAPGRCRDRRSARSSRRAGNPPGLRRSCFAACFRCSIASETLPRFFSRHGRVVQSPRARRGVGRAAVLLPLADRQVDAGPVHELLLVRVFLDEIEQVPLGLVELSSSGAPRSRGRSLSGRSPCGGKAPSASRAFFAAGVRPRPSARASPSSFELVDPRVEGVGEALHAHLPRVVFEELEDPIRSSVSSCREPPEAELKNGVF